VVDSEKPREPAYQRKITASGPEQANPAGPTHSHRLLVGSCLVDRPCPGVDRPKIEDVSQAAIDPAQQR
jgi:hypothetical protein